MGQANIVGTFLSRQFQIDFKLTLKRRHHAEEWNFQAARAGSITAPTLYACPVEHFLGLAQLMQCYMMGNTISIIPHALQYEVPDGAAADSLPDSGTGSHLFEVNIWM